MAAQAKVALLWHGDADARATATLETSRFALAAAALREVGIEPVGVVYNDDWAAEAMAQLLTVDAVQVWVNPIAGGRNRDVLDDLLRAVAAQGVRVFTHPDTILAMGTKQVLFDTRTMSWGSDVRVYQTPAELAAGLADSLLGGPRVLKQYRGHSGGGIWKVTRLSTDAVFLRHAERGSTEEKASLPRALALLGTYLENGGRLIDQAYQRRLTEGMTRIYMVGSEVAGFGFQEINALYPVDRVEDRSIPGPRLYYPREEERFAELRQRMEQDWLPDLLRTLNLEACQLPLLWDADLMLGHRDPTGHDSYVLCEINVSSVAPYPDTANPILAAELARRLGV